MRKRLLAISMTAVLGVGLAACGSAKAPGVQLAPGSGATASVSVATSTSTVSTPADLSTEPTVTPPKGPAPTKLVTKDLITGTGQAAKPGSTITVNYVGVLYKTGKIFDSSWQRHQAFTAQLVNPGVIAGWVKGIAGMKIGGRRELIIPASLAYGAKGSPGAIPPNAPLVFVVDLLSTS
jgi:peptidylprolyl isomerase